eukprot:TRINITY_DN7702_c2_g1_i1.p1 TRINITY_DN7702_c2_g1~~TRINITY_DN7702_c2_g1_i1.p1  ORF type:complete len:323 (+),score=54.17 TRINITY_DN7702_c2_g1_i1:1132-2100(+)
MPYYKSSTDFVALLSDEDCVRVFGPMRGILGPSGCTTADVTIPEATPVPAVTVTEIQEVVVDSSSWGTGVLDPEGLTGTPSCGEGMWDIHSLRCSCPHDPNCHAPGCVCNVMINCNHGHYSVPYQACLCDPDWESAADALHTLSFCDIPSVNATSPAPTQASQLITDQEPLNPASYIVFIILLVIIMVITGGYVYSPVRRVAQLWVYRCMKGLRLIRRSTFETLRRDLASNNGDRLEEYDLPQSWDLAAARGMGFAFPGEAVKAAMGLFIAPSFESPNVSLPVSEVDELELQQSPQRYSKSILPFGVSTEAMQSVADDNLVV